MAGHQNAMRDFIVSRMDAGATENQIMDALANSAAILILTTENTRPQRKSAMLAFSVSVGAHMLALIGDNPELADSPNG